MNFLAIAFVFLILLVNFKSLTLPVILTLVIESSIWINLGIPYFQGQTLFYIGYLIISTVQLGATIDYAILFSDRYMEFRRVMPGKEAARETLRVCTVSILTSAAVLTLAGVILGKVSTNGVLSQLGILIGRGRLCRLCWLFSYYLRCCSCLTALSGKQRCTADFTGLSLKRRIERKERKKVLQLRAGGLPAAQNSWKECAPGAQIGVYMRKNSMA